MRRTVLQMEALRQITSNINVFVNFFNSLNALFCQIRWLDRNIRNSSAPLLLVVGGIALFCYILYAYPSVAANFTSAPLVIVAVVVVVIVIRRYQNGPNHDVDMQHVLFGNPADAQENQLSSVEQGRPVKRGGSPIAPTSVRY